MFVSSAANLGFSCPLEWTLLCEFPFLLRRFSSILFSQPLFRSFHTRCLSASLFRLAWCFTPRCILVASSSHLFRLQGCLVMPPPPIYVKGYPSSTSMPFDFIWLLSSYFQWRLPCGQYVFQSSNLIVVFCSANSHLVRRLLICLHLHPASQHFEVFIISSSFGMKYSKT